MTVFRAEAVSSASSPDPKADRGSESAWFATALELVRTVCEANCNALDCAGRTVAVRMRRAVTAELRL
jgi:hypothetical protein